MNPTIGFTVIYRWRLHPGMEEQFIRQWSQGTQRIMRDEGGMGSRLHRAEDGTWLAYAQWPDKAAWENARQATVVDPDGRRELLDAIAESFPPILLTPVADFLNHEPICSTPTGVDHPP